MDEPTLFSIGTSTFCRKGKAYPCDSSVRRRLFYIGHPKRIKRRTTCFTRFVPELRFILVWSYWICAIFATVFAFFSVSFQCSRKHRRLVDRLLLLETGFRSPVYLGARGTKPRRLYHFYLVRQLWLLVESACSALFTSCPHIHFRGQTSAKGLGASGVYNRARKSALLWTQLSLSELKKPIFDGFLHHCVVMLLVFSPDQIVIFLGKLCTVYPHCMPQVLTIFTLLCQRQISVRHAKAQMGVIITFRNRVRNTVGKGRRCGGYFGRRFQSTTCKDGVINGGRWHATGAMNKRRLDHWPHIQHFSAHMPADIACLEKAGSRGITIYDYGVALNIPCPLQAIRVITVAADQHNAWDLGLSFRHRDEHKHVDQNLLVEGFLPVSCRAVDECEAARRETFAVGVHLGSLSRVIIQAALVNMTDTLKLISNLVRSLRGIHTARNFDIFIIPKQANEAVVLCYSGFTLFCSSKCRTLPRLVLLLALFGGFRGSTLFGGFRGSTLFGGFRGSTLLFFSKFRNNNVSWETGVCVLGTKGLSIRLGFLVSLGDHRSRLSPSRLTLMAWTLSHNDGTCIHLAFLYSALHLLKWVYNDLNSKRQRHPLLCALNGSQGLLYLCLLFISSSQGAGYCG